MPAVSCPCCDELVRLPATELPDNASIQCPWCGETLPSPSWQAKLPPMAIVLDADGRPIEILETQTVAAAPSVNEFSDATDKVSVDNADSHLLDDLGEFSEDVAKGDDGEAPDSEADDVADAAAVGSDADTELNVGVGAGIEETTLAETVVVQQSQLHLDDFPPLYEVEDSSLDDRGDDAGESEAEASLSAQVATETAPEPAREFNAPQVNGGNELEETTDLDTTADLQGTADFAPPSDATTTVDPDAAVDVDATVELDATADLDDEAALAGASMLQRDQDFQAGDVPDGSDAIDELENAWDTAETWSDPITDDPSQSDARIDRVDATEGAVFEKIEPVSEIPERNAPTKRKVPLQEESEAFYGPQALGTKSGGAARFFKVAAPTLIALPIILGILYASGVELGIFPFDGGGDESKLTAAETSGGKPSSQTRPSAQGRVLVDVDEDLPRESSDVTPDDFQSRQPEDPSTQAVDDAELGSDDDQADLTATEIVAGPFSTGRPDDQEAAEEEPVDEASNIDEFIQGLDDQVAGQNASDGPESMADDRAKETIAMRARRQLAERMAADERDEAEKEAALLNGATMTFPPDPPSADDIAMVEAPASEDPILQASAESDVESNMELPAETEAPKDALELPADPGLESYEMANDSENGSPANETASAAESVSVGGPNPQPIADPAEPIEPMINDSVATTEGTGEATEVEIPDTAPVTPMRPELLAAVRRAESSLEIVEKLSPENRDSRSLIAKLEAFRDVSRVASGSTDASFSDADSPEASAPEVISMLESVTQPNILPKLQPLCGEWIGWANRKTDGMLLIGKISDQEFGLRFVLEDGTSYRIEALPNIDIALDQRVVGLGKIIDVEGAPRIRISAAIPVQP